VSKVHRYRGVFAVLPSPFRRDGTVDLPSLERCVGFCIQSGAAGVVVPVNASEFSSLTAVERDAIVECVLGTAAGAIPVVVGVSARETEETVRYATHARRHHAPAIMAMAPFLDRRTPAEIVAHYAAIAAVFEGPIFIQSYHAYPASQLAVELMVEIASSIEGEWYVKEETYPAGQRMSGLLEQGAEVIRGVMGGMASRYVLDEFARGACGTMPACEVVDVHVALWTALEEGRADEARAIHERLLPLLNFEQLYGALAYKSVLHRRRIIAHPGTREGVARTLDAFDEAELDRLLGRLDGLLTAVGQAA
jgi:4-hydroxy-tetrahydrodipicolinate synthase